MQGRCDKHLFDPAEDRCGTCGGEFCSECLVYAFGPRRPPLCIPCAVAAAGIRRSAACSALSRRDAKRLERERRSAFKQARKARTAAARNAAAAPAAAASAFGPAEQGLGGSESTERAEPDGVGTPYELPQLAPRGIRAPVPAFTEHIGVAEGSAGAGP